MPNGEQSKKMPTLNKLEVLSTKEYQESLTFIDQIPCKYS